MGALIQVIYENTKKGINNVYQSGIMLGLDAVKIISEKLKEAHRLIEFKNYGNYR